MAAGFNTNSEGLGRGAEVNLALPAHVGTQAPVPLPATVTHRPVPAQAAASRILVMDDLQASAETLMTLLEMEGFQVRMAHDGQEALAIARDFKPNAVLLDIGLPGMNGFEVANGLRSQPESQDALLIALTGYGEAESRTRSAQAGFDFHMVKPADVNLLLTMLANPQEARKARLRPEPQLLAAGEVDERFKSHAWKACVGLIALRGFESRPLRQAALRNPPHGGFCRPPGGLVPHRQRQHHQADGRRRACTRISRTGSSLRSQW